MAELAPTGTMKTPVRAGLRAAPVRHPKNSFLRRYDSWAGLVFHTKAHEFEPSSPAIEKRKPGSRTPEGSPVDSTKKAQALWTPEGSPVDSTKRNEDARRSEA